MLLITHASYLADDKYLYETLKGKAYDLGIAKPLVPNYITENINFNLRNNEQLFSHHLSR